MLPFLKIGETTAVFQSDSNVPVVADFVNTIVNGLAVCSHQLYQKKCYNRGFQSQSTKYRNKGTTLRVKNKKSNS